MPKLPSKLTQRRLDSLRTDNPDGRQVADIEPRGFGVTVYPSGRKVFWVRVGLGSSRRQQVIDDYGVVDLENARERAREILRESTNGRPPAPAFDTWADEYLERAKLRKKKWQDDQTYLGRAKKRWGDRKLDEIRTDEIEVALKVEAEKSNTTANRWLASVRACLQDAWRAGLIADNPAARVRRYRENPPRQVVLFDVELEALEAKVDELDDEHERAAFELLLQTGARLSEVLRAKWADLDLDEKLWRIPSPKAGFPQVIPLPDRAARMLYRLPRVGDYVIPGRREGRPRYDLRSAWQTLKRAVRAKLEHDGESTDHWDTVRIHDFRRTFGLRVALDTEKGGIQVASKLLRHGDVRITERVYAPLGLDKLRGAMEGAQRPRKVVTFNRRAKGGKAK